jgi:ribokinase
VAVLGRVVVVGSCNVDLVLRVPRWPEAGETLAVEGLATLPGGKGLNQAVAARRAGATVTMVGRLGDDDQGRMLRAVLAEEGVQARYVRADAAGTGMAVVVVEPGGANRILVVPRANGRVAAEDAEAAREEIRAAGAVVVQGETPLGASLHAARLAAAAGVPLVFNPAPAPPPSAGLDALLAAASVVVPNERELAALTASPTTAGAAAVAEALARLRARAGGPVLATLGERGALLLEGVGRAPQAFAAPAVHAVDTVGAGDAFVGVLAACLAEGWDLARAAGWAVAAGALACTAEGALPAMPRREAIALLVAQGGAGGSRLPGETLG